jgi:HEAT repeat protein
MSALDILLVVGPIAAVTAWGALALYVIRVERERVEAHDLMDVVVKTLHLDEVRRLSIETRLERIKSLVDRSSRDMVMRVAANLETEREAFETLYEYLRLRWPEAPVIRDATAHRTRREKWRRTAALRIMARVQHPDALDILESAAANSDPDVASVAFALLGRSHDPRAADVLIAALLTRRHPASRVAVHLEQSPQPIADKLRPLLQHPDPVVRLWSATLFASDAGTGGFEWDLLPLVDDEDPRVRKAAIGALGKIRGSIAGEAAFGLLRDPVPYVRAHAARALAEMGRTDMAGDIAELLGDADWWVRQAAKESLHAMGTDVWRVLMPCLEHPDRFVRNGAAEVFQNLGIVDSLIVMEAASDGPAERKIEMLRQITAAGGVRFADSLVERAGPVIGARIRQLLATIGLEHVEAY